MFQYEKFDGGSTALSYFRKCVEDICKEVGAPVPDYATISKFYFDKEYSPVDVFRMTNDKIKITKAKITIEWTDQYGTDSRDFSNADQIRKFFEAFPLLKQYIRKNK